MAHTRRITIVASVLLIPLSALAVAACGGSGSAAAPTTASGASATVGRATTSLGSTLVSSNGRTLYLFKADHGTKSACAGACASAWPPLLGRARVLAGRRESGERQVLSLAASGGDSSPKFVPTRSSVLLGAGDRTAGGGVSGL